MSFVIVNGQVGCDEPEAIRFMGCSKTMFDEYKSRRIVKRLRAGWYAYEDLIEAVGKIRMDRDKVIHLEEATSGMETEENRDEEVGSQRRKPAHRGTQELLGRIQARGGR